MMRLSSLKIIAVAVIVCITSISSAQADTVSSSKTFTIDKTAAKPYRVLTSGKRITVQSKKDISKILVWTGTGHRFVEENNVNASSYSFNFTIAEKFFYIMLELKDGKRYTEKIGIQ